MASEMPSVFYDPVLDKTGLFGTHRRFSKINGYEKIFLTTGVIAAIITCIFTFIRLVEVSRRDEDFAYGIVILVNTAFLLILLITGILYQRRTDIIAFFISACMLTIYVIVHFIMRCKENGCNRGTDPKLRLARLITTIIFNILFFPLSIVVIKDYERDEFAKRLLGFKSEQLRPLRIYAIFDCIARINTMLSFSLLMLNLYNFNQFESTDTIFLIIGIPITLLWLGIGIGMVRIENYLLVVIFIIISFFQPAFIIYCLISAIGYSPTTPSPFTTVITSTPSSSFKIIIDLTSISESIVPVVEGLYVCIGLNILTHLLSVIFAILCIRNFGKGLKEKVFNSRADQFFQYCCCKIGYNTISN